MHIFWEVIGYIGTILVILSMMMTSVTKLRVINVCGAAFSTVYAVVCDAWAIVVMNVCLMAINIFHLIREYKMKKSDVQPHAE
ncbi:MAG: YgjV family protein [Lachnospiraceae bacterium]|nr:YgjV family protein [Lachnospiraceae bacterium]